MSKTNTPKTRIYAVAYGDKMRLVRAISRAQALTHVATGIISVSIPSTDEALTIAIKFGASVEDAKEAPTEPLPFETV